MACGDCDIMHFRDGRVVSMRDYQTELEAQRAAES
jgi:ketosteroid isomerase-like protein